MAVPTPGTLAQVAALRASVQPARSGRSARSADLALAFADAPRLAFAHTDWSGYSVFEEAFTLGHAAGTALG